MSEPETAGPAATAADTGEQDSPVRSRGAETRQAIMRAARKLFAQHGYKGTSLASVAASAGLSQPGLLHHYPSKTELLLAVLESKDSQDGRLSSPRLDAEGLGIIDGLGALVAHNQSEPDQVRMFSMLLGEAVAPDHPAHRYFRTRYDNIRQRFIRHLEKARDGGNLNSDVDVEALANVLIAVLDGLQFQWLLDESVDMSRSYAMVADLVRAALDPARPAREG
jgi:AcrR family transcriptional regulator